MTANHAYRLACEGTAIRRGDFQNARQLLQAMARRIDNKPKKKKDAPPASPVDALNLHRLAQSQRARTLAMLVLPLNDDYTIPLRRTPAAHPTCGRRARRRTVRRTRCRSCRCAKCSA